MPPRDGPAPVKSPLLKPLDVASLPKAQYVPPPVHVAPSMGSKYNGTYDARTPPSALAAAWCGGAAGFARTSLHRRAFFPLPFLLLVRTYAPHERNLKLHRRRPAVRGAGSFLGDVFPDKPILERLNWLHVPLLTITPLLAIFGMCTSSWDWRTVAFSVLYYFWSGLGITAGYHRHFAHKAYKATWGLKVALLLMGSAAVEGSAKWWCRDHRAHHRLEAGSLSWWSFEERSCLTTAAEG